MDDLQRKSPTTTDTLAGDVVRGWDDTSRLKARLESYSTLKLRCKSFLDWALENNIPLESKKIEKTFRNIMNCGQYLIFRNYIVSNKSRLIGACSCKQHLICAFCASRRGVKYSVAYKEKIEQLAESSPDFKMLFITFTVKNGDDLLERFTHLRHGMQALLQKRTNCLHFPKKTYTEFHKLTAGVFSYEFKRGSGGNQWHPHIHMISLIPAQSVIDSNFLRNEWLGITGDSSVINVKYVDPGSANIFLEVFAYALKFSEMSHPDRWHASQVLKGERLISSFGDLRGLQVNDDVNDDVLESDEPFVDQLFTWHNDRYLHHCDLKTSTQTGAVGGGASDARPPNAQGGVLGGTAP